MANRLVKSSASGYGALRGFQYDWTSELNYIEFDALRTVRTFAAGHRTSVSLVRLDRYPGAFFALKTIRKPDPDDEEEQEMVLSERKILSDARSDFILKLYRTFRDMRALYLLTEFLPGGDLYDLGQVSEDDAKFYFGCVVEALDYLHTRNIVHNDVKTLNLVLGDDGYPKLIDFGCAIQLEEGQRSYDDTCGTPAYLPPEVAWLSVDEDHDDNVGRDKSCDLWAMGVLLYELLTGISPFDPNNTGDDDAIFARIVDGIESLQFPREHISECAEDLIRNLCTYDPEFRLGYETMDEIREHRWFDGFDWRKLREKKLAPPMVPDVKSVDDLDNFTPDVSDTDSGIEEEESDWDTVYQHRW